MIKASYSREGSEYEVCVLSSPEGFSMLGNRLLDFTDRFEYQLSGSLIDHYEHILKSITIVENPTNESALLQVEMSDDCLLFRGGRIGVSNLGQSLVNFFVDDAADGEHFHLDYYEGNGVLAPTNCHLIFQCGREL